MDIGVQACVHPHDDRGDFRVVGWIRMTPPETANAAASQMETG